MALAWASLLAAVAGLATGAFFRVGFAILLTLLVAAVGTLVPLSTGDPVDAGDGLVLALAYQASYVVALLAQAWPGWKAALEALRRRTGR